MVTIFRRGFAGSVLLLLAVSCAAACAPDRSVEEDYAFLLVLEYDHRDTSFRERLVLRRDDRTGRCAAGIHAPERGRRIWFLLNGPEVLQVPGGGTSITQEEADAIRGFCALSPAAEERITQMLAAPSQEPPAASLAPEALSNARFFELARGYLDATPAAHALLDLTRSIRNESQSLTRTEIRVTVVFTLGLAEADAGHTATVAMNPAGDLLAVTISWNSDFEDSAP